MKGASVAAGPIAPRKFTMVGTPQVRLFVIDTVAAKDKAAAMLRVTDVGPRYCHTQNAMTKSGEADVL